MLKKVTANRKQLEKELKELAKESQGGEFERRDRQPGGEPRRINADRTDSSGEKTLHKVCDRRWRHDHGLHQGRRPFMKGARGHWWLRNVVHVITSCGESVLRYREEGKDGSIHVLIMFGAKNVRDGVPKGLTSRSIAKVIATTQVSWKRYCDKVVLISIQLCSMVEPLECHNIVKGSRRSRLTLDLGRSKVWERQRENC